MKFIIYLLGIILLSGLVFANTGIECLDENPYNICKGEGYNPSSGFKKSTLSCGNSIDQCWEYIGPTQNRDYKEICLPRYSEDHVTNARLECCETPIDSGNTVWIQMRLAQNAYYYLLGDKVYHWEYKCNKNLADYFDSTNKVDIKHCQGKTGGSKVPLIDENYFCKKAYLEGNNWYCEATDWGYCLNGCDKNTNKCIAQPNPTETDYCKPGNTKCDSTGNYVFECINGKWDYKDYCVDTKCDQKSNTYATCGLSTLYYCHDGYKCTFSSKRTNENCYDSLDACKNSIINWCYHPGLKECIKRNGNCQSGENFISGNDLTDAEKYTECVKNIPCNEDSDCPLGFECNGDRCGTHSKNEVLPEPSWWSNIMLKFREVYLDFQWFFIWIGTLMAILFLYRYTSPMVNQLLRPIFGITANLYYIVILIAIGLIIGLSAQFGLINIIW